MVCADFGLFPWYIPYTSRLRSETIQKYTLSKEEQAMPHISKTGSTEKCSVKTAYLVSKMHMLSHILHMQYAPEFLPFAVFDP